MKQDALAIVPMNISKLENVKIDFNSRITADEKKRLGEILRKNIDEKRCLLEAQKEEIKSTIVEAEKEKAGLPKYRAELDAIDEQISTLNKRKDLVSLRCENSTGFSVEGNLLARQSRGYGRDDDEKIWNYRHRPGLIKADAIRNKIELAHKQADRFGLKFDKVETRLVLTTTKGEAMEIMESVLGNGDYILNAEDKNEEDSD